MTSVHSLRIIVALILTGLGAGRLVAQPIYSPGSTIGHSTTSGVGIGTANPTATLDVVGSSQAQWFTVNNGGELFSLAKSGTAELMFFNDNTTDAYLEIGSAKASSRAHNGALTIWGAEAGNWLNRFDIIQSGGGFGMLQATTNLALQPNSGNVGVGTTSPGQKLDVVGAAQAQLLMIKNGGELFTLQKSGTAELMFTNDNTTDAYLEIGSSVSPTRAHNGALTIWGAENGNWLNRFDIIQSGSAFGMVQAKGNLALQPGSGNVGIGITNPTQKLSVNGTILAKEVIVQTGWPDYVFAKDYRLAPLSEVESRINAEGHLPGVPSAQEVSVKGVSLGEMQATLLAKIEELTLHQIQQEKEIAALRSHNERLEAALTRLMEVPIQK